MPVGSPYPWARFLGLLLLYFLEDHTLSSPAAVRDVLYPSLITHILISGTVDLMQYKRSQSTTGKTEIHAPVFIIRFSVYRVSQYPESQVRTEKAP